MSKWIWNGLVALVALGVMMFVEADGWEILVVILAVYGSNLMGYAEALQDED